MKFSFKKIFCFLTLSFFSLNIFAGPWLLPGSLSVKSDIDLLADAGIIKAPVMTWPIAWVNIGPELLSPETTAKIKNEPESVQAAYQRILILYKNSYQLHHLQTAVYASGSNRLNPFRTFQYQPYADFATGASAAYQVKHAAFSLNLSYYNAPNQSYSDYIHLDNSYADLLLGNWAIGFDQFNRWWGPGYSDSMILSMNAEPFPAFGIQRMRAEAFQTKWLHWIGPWSLISLVSEDGPSYYPYPAQVNNQLYWFTNIDFRPLESLQFDISRNVFFAGQQRSLSGPMLWYTVTFRNADASNSIPAQDVPGSETWDVGTQWSLLSTFHIPLTLYQQTAFMADTPAVIIPKRTAFLLGANFLSQLRIGILRTYFEYEYNINNVEYWWNFKCGDGNADLVAIPNFYSNGQYPYTYYNNILSSSLGSEGIGYTLGFILNENNNNSDDATIRFLELNSQNWGIAGTPGYPFAKQNILWPSIGRTIQLPHDFGLLNSEIGYLISLSKATPLSPGLSVTLTWSKNF